MKKVVPGRGISRRLSIFLFLMLAFLFVLNTASFLTVRRYGEAAARQRQGLEQLLFLERSVAGLEIVQAALQGIVMTGDGSHQEVHAQAVAQVTEALKGMAGRVVSPAAQSRLESLMQLAEQEIAFSRQVLGLYDRSGRRPARSLLETGRGDALIRRVRSLAAAWRLDEEQSLYEARERMAGMGRQARLSSLIGSVLAVVLSVFGVVVFAQGRRARERQDKELARLASIVSSCDDALVCQNLDGSVLAWNDGAQKIYGFSAGEAVGRHLSQIVPVTHQKEFKEMRARVLRGEHLRHVRTKRLTKDGRLIDVTFTIAPLYDEAGRIAGVTTISRDITEQRKMEEEVGQAMEIKSRFISIASHELRSPLTAIREGIALIAEGLHGPVTERQKELLDVALRNIDRLVRLSTDILNFQRIQTGQFRLIQEWHDPREILEDVVRTVRPLAKEKRLALKVDMPKALPRVVCDRDKATQVLLNIVNNALKFTQAGSVEIKAQAEPGAVHISVKDTGPGIAQDDMARLFGSFQQFGEASAKEGSGLGLFIARQIVEAHGGRIWAESQVGQGSVFHFTLPLHQSF